MLILTPTPLETAAERALFAELASWDTGGAVRAAVVASLPVVEGPMQRRQADAVLFVPEGLAVLRVVEVVRQSGVVTTAADGSWSIGPGAGPGEVLQLAGGGSNPLEGLMRAGMDAVVTLRRAGLEPGRIARLTVLTGAITGLLPADGDLGDGDQVAVLEPRSLLLGVARASRYAGTDNPRLWTTADVRAGIEALGVVGRSPAVEELNGEGFPYSPYVLRRRELIEPMNLPSARGAALPTASGPTAGHVPFTPGNRVAAAGPLVDPAAAARVAAAAVQAQEAAEAGAGQPATLPAAQPLVPTPVQRSAVPDALRGPVRDTIALPSEPAPAEADRQPGRPSQQPMAGPRAKPDDTGGLGGLFGEPAPTTRQLEQPVPPQPATSSSGSTSWGGSSGWDGGWATPTAQAAAPPPEAMGSRRRAALMVAAALVAVVVLGVGGWLLLPGGSSDDGGTTPSASTSTAAPGTATGPSTGTNVQVDGVTYTMQAGVVDDSCADHAYGSVAGFFAGRDCVGLSRALWSAEVAGQPAVVSLSRVVMPDDAAAQALITLTDGDGTGNVNDLLREDVSYAGAPDRLTNAQYASSRAATAVTIVEASWAGAGPGTSAELNVLASNALTLPTADVPGSAGD
ncbi:hypothetical protein SAMN05661080_04664 [Modestobacter sp. DSM 44400]|uniref:hypothetical protein n=1 Tax=Modestobacter sp. DSM 44400 TaxID=1550230 RepID=UPI00089C5B20|nr:hypothetical protein [Modestobacter sp. DSM 44400]SDY80626.1 hypothetical protein SAMN05661080_04664 [Modestobacter sp. DSM 44400]